MSGSPWSGREVPAGQDRRPSGRAIARPAARRGRGVAVPPADSRSYVRPGPSGSAGTCGSTPAARCSAGSASAASPPASWTPPTTHWDLLWYIVLAAAVAVADAGRPRRRRPPAPAAAAGAGHRPGPDRAGPAAPARAAADRPRRPGPAGRRRALRRPGVRRRPAGAAGAEPAAAGDPEQPAGRRPGARAAAAAVRRPGAPVPGRGGPVPDWASRSRRTSSTASCPRASRTSTTRWRSRTWSSCPSWPPR